MLRSRGGFHLPITVLAGAVCLCFSVEYAAGDLFNAPTVVPGANSTMSWHFAQPRARVLDAGQVDYVSLIDVSATTSALAELLDDDASIGWSNLFYGDPTGFGAVLAGLVDDSADAVMAIFASSLESANRRVAGRGITGGQASLGDVVAAYPPVAGGVVSLDLGTGGWRLAEAPPPPPPPVSSKTSQWSGWQILVAVGGVALYIWGLILRGPTYS